MTVPLRHFLVGLGFLLLGLAVGAGAIAGVAPGLATLAHVHLLLVGWVCLTIMGAMTQFVPVWSGVRIHSRRLATAQLWLAVVGLLGVAACFLAGDLRWLPIFGGLLLLGFWTFAYNVGRTLLTVSSPDVTERHFGLALGSFVVVAGLGLLLAVDFGWPVFASLPVSRTNVVGAHATLAVFGAVLTTVVGALYQLAPMFTQTELHGIDVPLRRFEEVGYPAGVALLALGRLLGSAPLARVGGALVLASLLGVGVILARRLAEAQVPWTPMLSRYAVAVPALGLWVLLTAPSWFADPLARTALLGAPGTVHLLFGIVGFVVLGTLYHVVPFIVWVHRYSDLLGHEPVPMIDDLYDGRVAAVDFAFLVGGTAVLVADGWGLLPPTSSAVGGALVLAGVVLFGANVLWVVREHSPHTLSGVVVGTTATNPNRSTAETTESADGR